MSRAGTSSSAYPPPQCCNTGTVLLCQLLSLCIFLFFFPPHLQNDSPTNSGSTEAIMNYSAAAVYGLEFRSRSIAAVVGESDKHHFLAGTLSLKGNNNQIHLLEYVESTNLIECNAIWNHSSEIWSLSCCPSSMNKDYFFTVWKKEQGSTGATLWSLEQGASVKLKHLLTLDMPASRVVWDPAGLSDHILVLGETGPYALSIVNMDTGCKSHKVSGKIPLDNVQRVAGGAWDPNHPNSAVLAADTSLVQCDLRAKQHTGVSEHAHAGCVCDVQYNANKMHHLASGGDDGMLKVWDMRRFVSPLAVVEAHDHWISSIRFNPFHDQLMLSSSTDCTVKLWNLLAVSSAAAQNAQELETRASEALLRTLNEYEDSVYSTAWSACTPWVFASVSYNGRVLMHQVPKDTKHKILLSQH